MGVTKHKFLSVSGIFETPALWEFWDFKTAKQNEIFRPNYFLVGMDLENHASKAEIKTQEDYPIYVAIPDFVVLLAISMY